MTSQVPQRAILRLPPGATGPVVTASATRDVRMHGFQIVGAEDELAVGVLVLDGELELQDVRISGADDAAVDIWGSAAVTLRANDIVDNAGVGVRVRNGARPALLHNRILRNGRAARAAAGVLLEPNAAPRLVGNVIADNGAEGIAGVAPAQAAEFVGNNVFVADARANARGPLGVIGRPARATR
jgi:hypothetical protein